MSVFDRAEKKIEGAVSGVFARAFRGDVQPVEITARLQRELDSEAQLLSRERKLVPNDFHVSLSPHDYARIAPYSRTLSAEIIPQLEDYAAEHGYIFNGAITIEFHEGAKLPTGKFKVASKAVADVAPAPSVHPSSNQANQANQAQTQILAVEVNGTCYELTPPGLTIGRGLEAELRINDPGISRQHARILVSGTGANVRATVEDLGSTNGIMLDGQRVVGSAPLTLGSRIGVGSTVLTIVAR